MLSSHRMQSEIIMYGLVSKCVKLSPFLLDNIDIRFDSKLYRQIVGIPMGTNCALPVADRSIFVLFERDFMLSFPEDNQSYVIKAFNSKSRCLDDLIIDNNFFDSMVDRIYPSELQLNRASLEDIEASFLNLLFSISDGFVKTEIYN